MGKAKIINKLTHVLRVFNPDQIIPIKNTLKISIPYDNRLSKNRRAAFCNNKYYVTNDARTAQQSLTMIIKALSPTFVEGKIWIDIFVEKPQARGDAINYVDTICDAVRDAIGVDDRWFSIRRLDWAIVKDNPKIYIGIGQEDGPARKTCSVCGRVMAAKEHFGQVQKGGFYNRCNFCRSRTEEITSIDVEAGL